MTDAVEAIKDHALNQPVSFTIAVAVPLGLWYYGTFLRAFVNDIAAPICQRDSTTKALSIYTLAVSPDLATVRGSTSKSTIDWTGPSEKLETDSCHMSEAPQGRCM